MKDIPVFATDNGVASLALQQIPYTQKAYIRIQSSENPDIFLEECVKFCIMLGAQHVYAAGHPVCENYPLHTAVFHMRCQTSNLPDSDASVFPVTDKTVERWRELYNEKACKIPAALWMDRIDAQNMLSAGDGYYIHSNGKLLGIGRAQGDTIQWISSVEPGAGSIVLCALAHAVCGDTVTLEVASANKKAIAFYDLLGFVRTAESVRWYQVK